MRPPATHPTVRRERGAATLVVVMMLFLIMALLAAYANRSMLFEQRIANSYYRASMAQEMSEAALEWATAMLNSTAVDANCKPVTEGGTRFAARYLVLKPEDRGVSQNAAVRQDGVVADCVRRADGWSCRCPALGGRTTPDAVSSTDLVPSFGIGIEPVPQGGLVRIRGFGCSSSVVDTCVDPDKNTQGYQALSRQEALLALVSAVRSPPAAPLVAKGNIHSTDGGLGLHNTAPGSAGLLAIAGGDLTGLAENRLESVPGTPPSQAQVKGDGQLTKAGADPFRMFMGSTAARYRLHPSLRKVVCEGDCSDALEAAYKAGTRIIWVAGPLGIGSNRVLGTATDPVVIVADGDVELTGPFQITGMLVSRGHLTWRNTSGLASLVNGIVLAEGHVQTEGTMDILYQASVVNQLRNRMGSFVRVPGSWSDSDQ